MKKLLDLIRNSTKESSTRILAYAFSFIICVFLFTFLGIEISNAIYSLKNQEIYHLTNEILIVFGSILAHKLTLLGINKYSETQKHKHECESKK